jgi:hypothetical protein
VELIVVLVTRDLPGCSHDYPSRRTPLSRFDLLRRMMSDPAPGVCSRALAPLRAMRPAYRGTKQCPSHERLPGDCTCRAARSAVPASQTLATKQAATPPRNLVRQLSLPRNGDRTGIGLRAAHVDIGALSGSRRSRRRGSQKWEPTCSAALGRSATQSDSSRR